MPSAFISETRTIQRWLASGTFPEAKKRRVAGRVPLTCLRASVLKRGPDGERNGLVLWREIKQQGYSGSERTVYRYLETLKQAEVKAPANLHRLQHFCATTAVWLFVRDPNSLDEIEQEDLATLCQVSTTLKKAYHLVQDFLVMVHQRKGERLDAWLAEGWRAAGFQNSSPSHAAGRERQSRGESWLNLVDQ